MIKVNLTDEQEMKDLCEIATQICNLERGSLSCKSQEKVYVLPRSVVGVLARKELGIHYNIIASMLNRDRSSIYHYERGHISNYEGWNDYRVLFNKIYNSYTDLRQTKKRFDSPSELIEYLTSIGVRHSKKPDLYIVISTARWEVQIDTDTKSFSKNMDLCKLALKDYNCKIYIKS
tara:strand:- start:634 stop:1161 length:528 start_codon:yes stop_codon:yes gene_type:complete